MKGRLLIFISLMLASCRGADRSMEETSSAYARYFDILDNPARLVVMSPYDAAADTLMIDRPLDNLICMSSSHVAALSAIGADSVITAVLGIRYISDPAIHLLFPKFGPLADGLPIYNNTLRTTPEGGNDFWESGAVRPDLILEDLRNIISGNQPDSLNYYIKVD